MQETRENLKNEEVSIRNLEVQVGQTAKQLAENPTNFFPSDTIPNSREEYKAISLKSRKVINKELPKENEKITKDPLEEKKEEKLEETPAPTELKKEKMKLYEPRISYPQRLQNYDQKNNLFKFLDVFKKLQVNIPFPEALEQMPLYVKFMKELLPKRKSLKEDEKVILTKECSAIIQKKLPQTLKDPDSF
ncbi:uncharacterized protein LOC107611247 [Arachis ipaensis]|uniref:uncharacterized protein LOC107611247 n=1 Tax=Arachis ipaensis TaxID=130454 RepID=UPI0007AF6670|nr:uncharacterized protein LOC107611247 [Arachis ipaensis]